ncbi:putative quinol monooxygenase [Flavobacterium anhuiense]|uniref:putative quinol monooxygenase n=1 Tax=Flavobacterium anhuiense TaxID=459526 RepID=UPI003D9526FD
MNILFKKTNLLLLVFFFSIGIMGQNKNQIVRIAEIEVFPEYLDQYKAILKEEAQLAVQVESGVIAILPMFRKENSPQIRILEIYADNESYEAHLKTPHFLLYKNSTLKMVKSLQLMDMDVLDLKTMRLMFAKYSEKK